MILENLKKKGGIKMAFKVEKTEIDFEKKVLGIIAGLGSKCSIEHMKKDLKREGIEYNESELASALEYLLKDGKVRSVDPQIILIAELGKLNALVMSNFAPL